MTDHLASLFSRYPILRECERDLRSALELMIRAFQAGNKLLVCGNGGSAADCEHLVGELMKGFLKPRPLPQRDAEKVEHALASRLQGALPAISLVSQTSLISAVLNDTAGDMIFAQQVYGLGKPGDLLLAISTSGNSTNVVNAVSVAKAFGLKTIALVGRAGGAVAHIAEIAIRVPADGTLEIQELHLPVYHWLAVELEDKFFD